MVCRICGRPLTSPSSIAAGVCPICGSRRYSSRIKARHGSTMGGWSEIEEWEKVNSPCYSCKNFEFPGKGQEAELVHGFRVEMRGQVQEFGKKDIGGYCKALKKLVDGNLINGESLCSGNLFYSRKRDDEQPQVGLLHRRNGQIELFKI